MRERLIRFSLPQGDDRTKETLRIMREIAKRSDDWRSVKNQAVGIISSFDPRAKLNQIMAVHNFVGDRMVYVPDIHGVEEIQAPWIHIDRIQKTGSSFGDCDDYALLGVSLMRAVGFPTAFSAIATGRRGPNFDHVRAAVNYEGKWVALESTAKGRPVGWEIPHVREIRLEV